MGAARLVTARPLDGLVAFHRKVDRGIQAGQCTPLFGAELAADIIRLCDHAQFVHNRVAVADHALHDVKDVRIIEEKCLRAYISPVTFDLGPEAA